MDIRQAALLAGVVLYPFALRSMLGLAEPALAGMLSLVFWSVIVAVLLRRAGVWLALGLLVLLTLAAYRAGWAMDHLLYLPPFVLNTAVAAFFLCSLRVGREPLITRFARIARGHLEPAMRVYTRRLTWVWGVFCAGLAIVSLLLAWLAPLSWWLMFTSGLNYALMLLLFLAENLYRRWRFRQVAHVSPLRMWRLIRAEVMQSREGGNG